MASDDRLDSTNDPPEGAARRERLRRALRSVGHWIAAHRKSVALGTTLTLLLMLGCVGLWFSLAAPHLVARQGPTLQEALAALDRGEYVRARHLAKQVWKRSRDQAGDLAGPAFVLGAATFHEVDEGWIQTQTHGYLLAARYLQLAMAQGFPERRRGEGLFMAAKSLYMSGQAQRALPLLLEVLHTDWRDQKEVHQLLAETYAGADPPELDKALEHNRLYLADLHLAGKKRTDGQLARCRLLLLAGHLDQCRKALAEIPTGERSGAEAMLIEGRMLMEEARQLRRASQQAASLAEGSDPALEKYRQAIEALGGAQAHDSLDKHATRASMYLIGVCKSEMGPPFIGEAIEQLARTRKLHFDSPEGLAASLLEGELLERTGRSEEAVAVYRLALAQADSAGPYNNRWVSLKDLRSRLLAAYEAMMDEGQFEHAERLVEGFPPIVPQIRSWQLMARTAGQWASALEQQAEKLPVSQAEAMRAEARAHYRRAGTTYRKLAAARPATRQYPQDLRQSAQYLLEGHDYRTAAKMFETYLDEPSQPWRPQALLGLGQADLAIGNVEQSIRALRECIAFHSRDVAVYQARLWCSKAYLELGENAKAESLLRDNLTSESLTPSSNEWRDSLFALGQLLFVDGRYSEAIEKLEEAVARYADSPQVLQGTFTIAEAYRLGAKAPQKRFREAAVMTVRVANRQRARQMLQQALRYYDRVQSLLLGREEHSQLTKLDKTMLRHCYFAKGSVLFDLERYDEAINTYSHAATRYQNEPIVLETFLQLAYCYRRQNRPFEARGALEQAKVVLKRLDEHRDFTRQTNYSREEWVALLDRLSI